MFKNHLSLIFALIVMLLSIQSLSTLTKLSNEYEQKITKNYSIIIVCYTKTTLKELQKISPHIKSIAQITPDKVINSIKKGVSATNLALLKSTLPKFYRLKLDFYPSKKELEKLKKSLEKNKNISRVESFAKTQNIIYKMLILNKTIIGIFAVLVFLIAVLLVIRQMEVWRLKHSQRMKIMAIFGAPLWLRSAMLFRLAVVDSVIASVFVGGVFYYLSYSKEIKTYLEALSISGVEFGAKSAFVLFLIAITISIFSIVYVIIKSDQERQ